MDPNSEPVIFVVDDDEVVRDSMKAVLEARGYQVRDFSSASGFLEEYQKLPFGCLLLDIHMQIGRAHV